MRGHLQTKRVLYAQIAVVVALIVTALFLCGHKTESFIDLTVQTDTNVDARLYFDIGTGFNSEDSAIATVMLLDGNEKLLRFPVPAESIKAFRFDPFHSDGSLVLTSLQVVKPKSEPESIAMNSFVPAQQIKELSATDGGVLISATEGATNPYVFLLPQAPVDLRPGLIAYYLPAAAIMLVSFVTVYAFLLVSVPLHRKLMGISFYRHIVENITNAAIQIERITAAIARFVSHLAEWLSGSSIFKCLILHERRQLVALSLSVFLVIAGSRLLMLNNFGTDLPWFDSWAVEGEGLYKPFLEGTLKVEDFFLPCNEHRILFTRILALGLLLLNGLWDNLLQTVINALIYTAAAMMLFLLVARKQDSISRIFWALAIIVTFSSPYGWENALWGFQSQFYLLAAFSIAVLYLACKNTKMDMKWYVLLGLLQISALFTMASGLMASMAALCIYLSVFLRNWHDSSERRMLIVKTVIAVTVLIVGSQLLVHVNNHEKYKAESLGSFLTVFTHCASWPHIRSDSWWLFNWLPWLILLVMYLFRKIDDRTSIRFAVALGFWVILQEIATSYSRNALALISKYSDPIAIGLAVNALAMIILFSSSMGRYKKYLNLFVLFWVTINSYYLFKVTSDSLTSPLPGRKHSFEIQISKTRDFLRTGEISMLTPEHKYDIPHRDVNQYAKLLRDPVIRSILPKSVNDEAVVSGKPHAYLSLASNGMLKISGQILLSGAFLMLVMSILLLIKHCKQRIDHG